MMNKVLDLNVKWSLENYTYSHKINLDDKLSYISNVSFKNKLLEEPNHLFKFYGDNKYNLNSLLEGYLYFSSPKKFNDPFDCTMNRVRNLPKKYERLAIHYENIGVCSFSIRKDNPLMWGHYANNYRGFGIKFKNQSLLIR